MTFDLQTVLPKQGVELDPYHDPHEVYLMLVLTMTRSLESLFPSVPPECRSLRKLRNLGDPPQFWSDVLLDAGGFWISQNAVQESEAMVNAFAKAHMKVLGVLFPELVE